MKKTVSFLLTFLFIASFGALAGCGGAAERASVQLAEEAQAKCVYLMPGTFQAAEGGVANTLSSGAEKLTSEEEANLFLTNAYRATAAAGQKLPQPATTREGFVFHGWWYTVNALITYADTMPDMSKAEGDIFLYADWRAEISLPMDPVNPDPDSPGVAPKNYLKVTRAETGLTEYIELFVAPTDVPDAVGRVQYYNENFALHRGDTVEVYTTGIYGDKEAVLSPQPAGGKYGCKLEDNPGYNMTGNYLKDVNAGSDGFIPGTLPVFKVVAEFSHPYKIYVKFYNGGGWMTIYMEALDFREGFED